MSRTKSVEDRLDEHDAVLGGDISGKEGLVQVVQWCVKKTEEIDSRVKSIEKSQTYAMGWILGAAGAGGLAAGIIQHFWK